MREMVFGMKVTNKTTYLVAGYEVTVIEYYGCLYAGYAVKDSYTVATSKSYTTEYEAFQEIIIKIRDMQGVLTNGKN